MQTDWTPFPFNLLAGNPFSYSSRSISAISGTEAFTTGIDVRDQGRCVVCGISIAITLEHVHIVPKVEHNTWEEMRDRGFIPRLAKSVVHEARNGMLMCVNHHTMFNGHYFYICWVPEHKHFVLINHSQIPELEKYHGRAILFLAGDQHLPFHGSFLIHEMRVRGRWPFHPDRPISLPAWIATVGDNGNDEKHDNPDAATRDSPPSAMMQMYPPIFAPRSGPDHQHPNDDHSFPVNVATQQLPQTFTPTNLFANPAELQAMKHSFAQQPNWKAAVIEGESWEGNAEENIAKWQRLVGESSS